MPLKMENTMSNWKTSLLSAAKHNSRFLFSSPLLAIVVAIVGPVGVAKAVSV